MTTVAEALALARRHLQRKETEQAISILTAITEQAPNDTQAHEMLGEISRQRGDLAQTLNHLQRAQESLYARAAHIRASQASVLRQHGQSAQALKLLQRDQQLVEQFPESHFQLASSLYDVGEHQAAIAHYHQIDETHPGNPDVLHGLGAAHMRQGNLMAAADCFDRALRARHAGTLQLPTTPRTRIELEHLSEQLSYLRYVGELEPQYGPALTRLKQWLSESITSGATPSQDIPKDVRLAIEPLFTELVHYAPPAPQAGGALNASLDFQAIETDYASQGKGIAIVDDLLASNTLAVLNEFLVKSTIWRHPYPGGYIGTFPEHGVFCPLVAQVASELKYRLPNLLGPHELMKVWAFKYDSDAPGIGTHADDAAVNVNFWLTPDTARSDEYEAGLTIWDKPPPADWDFKSINNYESQGNMERYLEEFGAQPHAVAYKANRAAIFCSDLFHRGTPIAFKPGYANRRINLTFLFGHRGAARRSIDLTTVGERLQKAYSALASGALEKTLKEADAILKHQANNVEALTLATKALSQIGRHNEAISYAMRAVASAPSRPDLYASLADVQQASGQIENALQTLSDACTRFNNDPTLVLALAELALNAGQLEVACERLAVSRQQHPNDPRLADAHGVVLQRMQDLPAAIRALEVAHNLAPNDVGIRRNLSIVLTAADQCERASQLLTSILETQPDDADAHLRLSRALVRLGEFDRGLEHAAEGRLALGRAADLDEARRLEARLWCATEKSKTVAQIISRKGMSYAGAIALGNAKRNEGDLVAARANYQQATKIAPDKPLAWLRLGTVSALLGDGEAADDSFRNAVQPQDDSRLENLIHLSRDYLSETLGFDEAATDLKESRWNVSEGQPLTVLASADSVYVERFAESLVASFVDNSDVPVKVHLHIVNLSVDARQAVDSLQKRYSPEVVGYSTENFEVNTLKMPKTYYACARFLHFPKFAKYHGGPVLIADMDLICMRSLGPLLNELRHAQSDVGVFALQPSTYDLWDHYQASALFVANADGARSIMGNACRYIEHQLKNDGGIWYLDQIALFAALRYALGSRPEAVHELPVASFTMPTVNPLDPSTQNPRESSVFWSLLASVPANRAHLDHPIVKRYRGLNAAD